MRDEKILSIQPLVAHLVKKYNNGEWDEDLHSDAMITAIICIDKSLHLPEEDIDRRVLVWVSNRLQDMRKRKQLTTIELDSLERVYDTDNYDLLIDVIDILSQFELDILTDRLEGLTRLEICKKRDISNGTYYNFMNKIKRKVNDYIVQ